MKKTVIILFALLIIPGCSITTPEIFGIIDFTFEPINNQELTFPVSAIISGTTIKVELPFDTDITSLSPTIVLTDDTVIMPQSGSIMDFSMPVFYIVTSVDTTKSLTYAARVTLKEEE